MHFATLSVCNKIIAMLYMSRAEVFSNKTGGGVSETTTLLAASRALPALGLPRWALGSGVDTESS